MEADAQAYIERIDEMGGILRAVEVGFPQREIADAAFDFQMAQDGGEYVTVGVNGYTMDETDHKKVETLKISLDIESEQRERVVSARADRDDQRASRALTGVREAAAGSDNLMPPIIDAVRASCTVGEISDVFRDVFGVYGDPAWV